MIVFLVGEDEAGHGVTGCFCVQYSGVYRTADAGVGLVYCVEVTLVKVARGDHTPQSVVACTNNCTPCFPLCPPRHCPRLLSSDL